MFQLLIKNSEAPRNQPFIIPDPEHIGNGDGSDDYGSFSALINDRYIVRTLVNSFHILCYDDSALSITEEPDDFFDIGSVEMIDVHDLPHRWTG
jgi:hypothetical protein